MSDSSKNHEIIAELVEAFCRNEITPEQTAQLDELLQTDKEARRYYIRYLHMHSSLRQMLHRKPEDSERSLLESLLDRAEQESSDDASENQGCPLCPPIGLLDHDLLTDDLTASDSGLLGYVAKQCGSIFTNPFRLGVLTTLVLIAYFSGYRLADLATNTLLMPQAQAVAIEKPAPVIGARYVHGVDTVWDKSGNGYEVGDPLIVGSVMHLEKGVAEVAFNCGAKVFLNGPAKFTVISPMAGTLDFGHLTTDVPEEAKGFLIETPQASIVDQGTSVSVSVDQDGNSKAFVHEGEVLVGVETPENGQRAVKRLTKGEGVQIIADMHGTPIVHDIEAPPGQLSLPKMEMLPEDTPRRIAGLRLWLAADTGVFRDLEGTIPAEPGDHVARWIDQSGNQLSPVQPVLKQQPYLVVNEFGKRTLRFDGVCHHLEEPSSGSTNLVLDSSDRSRPQFTMCMIFNSQGPERIDNKQTLFGQYTDTTIDTSRLLGLMHRGRLFYDEWLPSKMYLLSEDNAIQWEQTYIVVLTRDGNARSIHVNGDLVIADNEAECYAGNQPTHWWIGGRKRPLKNQSNEFFRGDISEFIVFTRALPEDTRKNVEMYLMNKYLHAVQ